MVCKSIRHSHGPTTVIIQKASRRLYFLKQLKRAVVATHHLLAVIRPVLEYCAPVWHYGVTKAQIPELEAIQKRAIHIISHFTRGMLQTSTRCPVVETTPLAIFLSVLLILHPVYTISFPHPDLMQLHLGEDHTKFTQDRPPVQNDIVPLCNMPFLTTRKGLPTVNIHPSVSFYTCWGFQLLTVNRPIIIPITFIVLGLLPYITFLHFVS